MGGAQPNWYMADPVFGIGYDTRKVSFERVPASLEKACAADLGGRKNFWIYAHWKENETEYFVISNRESQESGGAAVIRDGLCTLGLPEWVLTGQANFNPGNRDTSIRFPPTVLQGLAKDLLRRYMVAFGSKKNFLEAVRKDGFPPDEKIPVLKNEFDTFSKSPN
jgi:hypothetical protein